MPYLPTREPAILAGESTPTKRSRRGFASMSPERQREIAGKGGREAHRLGRAHKWTSETAAEAGRRGGMASKGREKHRKQVQEEAHR